MTDQGDIAVTESSATSVRRSITVDVDREHAFTVFTEGIGGWWNPDYHIGSAEFAEAVVEPKEGGRWFERGVDGSECDWGHVIAYEPPNRLVLAWQINENWQFDPELVTELEVVFVSEGPHRTRVELEHRNLDRLGSVAEAMRGGWPGLLERYVEATAR